MPKDTIELLENHVQEDEYCHAAAKLCRAAREFEATSKVIACEQDCTVMTVHTGDWKALFEAVAYINIRKWDD